MRLCFLLCLRMAHTHRKFDCAASLGSPDRLVRAVGVYRVLCEDQRCHSSGMAEIGRIETLRREIKEI